MIALRLRFPTGRYHATPWGRHVNEAAIAWPPEPVRILRALIACHHRKADKTQFSDDALADLIDALAGELPIYKLPQAVHAHTRHYMPARRPACRTARSGGRAVHAHTRHYMPARVKTTLVFDAFARFDADEPLIVGWPGLSLSREQRAHLDHLVTRLGYLGRAESWVDAEVFEWSGDDANAKPRNHNGEGNGQASDPEFRLVSLYAPLLPEAYRERRERLIYDERERRRAGWTKKGQPTDKALEKDMRDFLTTLPERLALALAVDTSDLHAVGWSDPPACRRVLYAAPEPASVWRGPRRGKTSTQPDPTVARFVLAGRPRPRIEDAVKIGELMRVAALAQFGWAKDEASGRWRPSAPPVISGRDAQNRPLRAAEHRHAFWLSEDADGDGEIDHIVVYAREGLDGECRRKLDLITKLWIDRRGDHDGQEATDSGRKEWRLALEGFGQPKDFAAASALFSFPPRRKWRSITPYLTPWHTKEGFTWADQIVRELRERGLPKVSEPPREVRSITINGRKRRPIHFHRFRSRRGLRQPDALGRFVELTLEQPIGGPLALGYACHFGLGLFEAID